IWKAISKSFPSSQHRHSKRMGSFSHHCFAPPAMCPEPDGDVSPSRFSSVDLSYITQGETALQRALSILQQHTSWQTETLLDAGAVSSTALPGLGKVFRAEVVLAVPVAQLHRELFERIEQMPQWNPTLSRVKVLQRVGTDTLVTHEVTAPSPGNLVGQRDFVSVRHRGRRETAIYLVGTATHIEPLPLQEGCIRAESRLSCIVLQPLAGDPGCTRLTWLLSMDLKGWIPASVINRVLPQSQADFIKHLPAGQARGMQPELETHSSPFSSPLWPSSHSHQQWGKTVPTEQPRARRTPFTQHRASAPGMEWGICKLGQPKHPRALR
uniref:START domain-containing protein n=1 Tax=Athene cunicularia TaxID=194338 RepID=A0A663N988_ATHCN